ncbi:MAG TPA: hypothetical protein VJX67_17890 [Blastocatellia bacterium]|nr:hypothetical protein [Blastocatellia bacterium]
MEMEKSHYVVSVKPAYFDRLRESQTEAERQSCDADGQTLSPLVVTITQGGFGQDIVDDERQVKERFLEYLFVAFGVDLPRTEDSFDSYFELAPVEEVIDLDEDF